MEVPEPTRTDIRERYEDGDIPTSGHENFGDANPEGHGGIWVTYDRGDWHVYETVMSVDVGFEADEEDGGDQYVTVAYVDWRELVTEDGQWTDSAQRFVDTFARPHETPMGAVVDGRMTAYAAWYATERTGGGKRVQKDTYEAVLDSFGIDPIE